MKNDILLDILLWIMEIYRYPGHNIKIIMIKKAKEFFPYFEYGSSLFYYYILEWKRILLTIRPETS